MTFADVIDAWVAWAGEGSAGSTGQDSVHEEQKIRQFILHFCSANRIPPKFYETSSTIEFRARAHIASGPV